MSPTTVASSVPGEPAVPIVRNHAAPLARMWTAVASVSTLFTAVGLLSPRPAVGGAVGVPVLPADRHAWRTGPAAYGGRSRGSGSRPSMTSSSAFSSPYRYSSGPSTTEIVRSSEEARPAQLQCRPAQRRRLGGVRRLGGQEDVAGPDGERGDGGALHHPVGVAPHEQAVLEGGGLPLGAVGHDVALPLAAVGDRPPLAAGREAAPAPPAKPGRRRSRRWCRPARGRAPPAGPRHLRRRGRRRHRGSARPVGGRPWRHHAAGGRALRASPIDGAWWDRRTQRDQGEHGVVWPTVRCAGRPYHDPHVVAGSGRGGRPIALEHPPAEPVVGLGRRAV